MLSAKVLKELVHQKKVTKTNRLLLCLGSSDAPLSVAQVRAVGKGVGISGIKTWNVSQLLAASGKAIRINDEWELNGEGRRYVREAAGPALAPEPPQAAANLRSHLVTIADTHTRSFVEEAITCFEFKQYRAAIVLAWVGAVAVLQDFVVAKKLQDFNAAAVVRFGKWKPITTTDGFGSNGLKEADFLQLLQDCSVIGKNVKQQLKERLDLRNGCGHPNSLSVAEHIAASHIELLILNVFSRF